MSLNETQTRVLGIIKDHEYWVTLETFKHLDLNKPYLTNIIHSLKKAGMLPRGFRAHRGFKIGSRLPEFIDCIERGLFVQDFALRFKILPSQARKMLKRLKASDHPRCRNLTIIEDPNYIHKPRSKPKPKPKPKFLSGKPTREEKLDKLIKYIEKKDFWVTSVQCAKFFGCKPYTVRTIIRKLKNQKRLPPGFNVIPLRKKSPLSRHLGRINSLAALESKAKSLDEIAEALGMTYADVKSMRFSLMQLRHPKFMRAVKAGREIKRRRVKARKDKPFQSVLIERRFNDELMKETGMNLEQLNAYNAVNIFSDLLMDLIERPETIKIKKLKSIGNEDIKYMKRHGLIEKVSAPEGGVMFVTTTKAYGFLFVQGYTHPKPMKPYIISDEPLDEALTVSRES